MGFPTEFPHMREQEITILKRYFASGLAPEGNWTIDFRFPLNDEQKLSLNAAGVSEFGKLWEKRVEALCENASGVIIVEVKERVNSMALGQLLNYRDLYRQFFNASAGIRMICVAGGDDPALSPSLRAVGIEIVIV